MYNNKGVNDYILLKCIRIILSVLILINKYLGIKLFAALTSIFHDKRLCIIEAGTRLKKKKLYLLNYIILL